MSSLWKHLRLANGYDNASSKVDTCVSQLRRLEVGQLVPQYRPSSTRHNIAKKKGRDIVFYCLNYRCLFHHASLPYMPRSGIAISNSDANIFPGVGSNTSPSVFDTNLACFLASALASLSAADLPRASVNAV